ncbi:MAG TPA: hypothetical protein VFU15_09030 [Bacteroidia bacterium]|nr:hypothetical protein [Bacteroidia bacterium]
MKRSRCLFLFFIAFIAALPAQQLVKKKIVYDSPGILKKGMNAHEFFFLPFNVSDTTSDETLLSAMDSVPPLITQVVYGTDAKDTTKYNVIIAGSRLSGTYSVTRVYPDGCFSGTHTYGRNHRLTGGYATYYPGNHIKSAGQYMDGKKQGRWRLYDENGRLLWKGKYRNDSLVKAKDYGHSRFTIYSLYRHRDLRPYNYVIVYGKDTAADYFPEDTANVSRHLPFGMNCSADMYTMDFHNARNSMPQLGGYPNDYCIAMGDEIYAGYREKFFVTAGLHFNLPKEFTGNYPGYGKVAVEAAQFRAHLDGNLPVIRNPKRTLFVYGGIMFARTYLTSLQRYDNGNSVSYFETSHIKQSLADAGLLFECTARPFTPRYTGYFSIKAGVNYPIGNAQWYYFFSPQVTYPESGKPGVKLGVFYFSVGFTIWKSDHRRTSP